MPVSYSDNSFTFSPYQDWTISWSVSAGSIGTVATNSSISFTLSAGIVTGVPETPYPVTYTITSAPAGTSFNTSTGVLSGNPSSAGTHNFTVEATNGYATQTRNYSLSVINVATSVGGGIMMSGGITVNS